MSWEPELTPEQGSVVRDTGEPSSPSGARVVGWPLKMGRICPVVAKATCSVGRPPTEESTGSSRAGLEGVGSPAMRVTPNTQESGAADCPHAGDVLPPLLLFLTVIG